jgi:hypothetical protein
MTDTMAATESRPRTSRRRLWIAIVLTAILLGVGFDLFGPLRVDLRRFDPDDVARLDTVMWRSYYDRKPLALFFQLADLMRRQFHFPPLRSHVVAASAAKAAFVFKDGHDRGEYERALPDLIRYYEAIRAISSTPFDVERTARAELEWWIVHRQRARQAPGNLERSLAIAAGELYRKPAAVMAGYARERREAMDIRDRGAVRGGVTEAEWANIEEHLRASWRSLHDAVRR